MNERSSTATVLRGTGVVASLTALSRVLGFVRDLLFARLFGATYIGDAFFAAFRIPNLLRSFVAEGALTSAFVPVFSSELQRGEEHARETIRAVTGLLIGITTVLSLLGIILAQILGDFFFGAGTQQADLCAHLIRIMMPFIIFVSLVAMLNGALNSVKIFGAAAFAQVAMNIALIAGAIMAGYSVGQDRAIALALWVLIGGMLQILVQVPALRRSGFSLRPLLRCITPATKQILTLMLPALLGAAVYQLGMFLNTLLAARLAVGSISWLFYADRIAQLPIGIFTIALASVLLPTLSNIAAARNEEDFSATLLRSLQYTSFLIVPTAFGIFMLAEPLITLVFQRGSFSIEDSRQTAHALQALAPGLWAVSCYSLITRAFLAKKDPLRPALVGIVTLLVSVSVGVALMGPPRELDGGGALVETILLLQSALSPITLEIGHVGLAAASSTASLVSLVMIGALLGRYVVELQWSNFFRTTFSAVLSATVMALALEGLFMLVQPAWLQIVIGIPCGAAIYFGIQFLLRSHELRETFATLRRILGRG